MIRGPRPPDAELRALRGIAYALILVLPFWLAVGWAIATLGAGTSKGRTPTDTNEVPGHLLTMSRDFTLEPPRGFEPRTCSLRVSCSTPELRRRACRERSALPDPDGPPNRTEAPRRDPNAPAAASVGRADWRPRYPDPVDTPESQVSDGAERHGRGPTDRARSARRTNGCRAQNRLLTEQMAAIRAAQEELAKHLKVTAPLRRVQESLRHRAGETARGEAARRRDRAGHSARLRAAPASGLGHHRRAGLPPPAAGPDPRLARRPDRCSPSPTSARVRTGCAGRVLVIAHVFYPELWPRAGRADRADPGAGRPGRDPRRGALRGAGRRDRGPVPGRAVRGRAEPRARHVAVRAGARARAGRRLRRRAQAAHQGQRASDRRGRLARPAARLAVPVAGGDRADPRAAAPRPDGRDGRPRRCGARPGVLGVQRADGRRPGGADRDRRRPGACLVPGRIDVLEPTRAAEPAARCTAHDRGLRARGGLDRRDDGARAGAVRGGAGRRCRAVGHRRGRGGR